MYEVLNECRVIKDDTEIEIMSFITKISSDAHIYVMQNVRPGLKEFQLEALFRFYVMERCGAKHKSYDCICATGLKPATLHYNINSQSISDNVLCLCDMGSKMYGYCSDITCVYPSNGKFT